LAYAKIGYFIVFMAEREGFEPSVELSPHTRLAGERLQPARPSLRRIYQLCLLEAISKDSKFTHFEILKWLLTTQAQNLAEGVGFEPTELLHSTVFKTAAFDHSAIPPLAS
jgi:hypothetical protein